MIDPSISINLLIVEFDYVYIIWVILLLDVVLIEIEDKSQKADRFK